MIKEFRRIIYAIALLFVVSLLYAAASHFVGPVVSGTKAQGNGASIATGAGEIFANGDIEADGNLDVAGTSTFTGGISASGISASGISVSGTFTVVSTTTINQVLVLSALSYEPGAASTGTIYMDSSYVVKVCTSVTGSTRYFQSVGAQ